VEETLNKLLEEEAERLCGARRYEHSTDRQDTLAGSYSRKFADARGRSGFEGAEAADSAV